MYEIQHEIELTYGKGNIRKVVVEDIDQESVLFKNLVETIYAFKYKEYSYKSKIKRVAHLKSIGSTELALELLIAVITTDTVVTPIQVIIGRLVPHLNYSVELDAIKTAAELLAVCEGELYSLYSHDDPENDTETLGLKPHYQLSLSVREFIAKTKYLPPMICKPLDWRNNNGSGHLTGSGSILLGSKNDVGQVQNLEFINTLQAIEWELNEEVLEFVEESKKKLDTYEKKQNFERMTRTSEIVYQDLIEQGNCFYFVWKYDFRGRSYSQGFHVNLQSNSYRKAILNFKHKELLTEEIIL